MKTTIATIQGVEINLYKDPITAQELVCFVADADIDADGCNGQTGGKAAYRPDNTGLDDLSNAKNGSEWVGIVTVGNNTPVHQLASDPDPGAFISQTALQIPGLAKTDPNRYVDGMRFPFAVVPPIVAKGTKGKVLGCKVTLRNTRNGRHCTAVVADIGPTRKIGELSPAAAIALGLDPNARHGGTSDFIISYIIEPGVPANIDTTVFPLQSYGEVPPFK